MAAVLSANARSSTHNILPDARKRLVLHREYTASGSESFYFDISRMYKNLPRRFLERPTRTKKIATSALCPRGTARRQAFVSAHQRCSPSSTLFYLILHAPLIIRLHPLHFFSDNDRTTETTTAALVPQRHYPTRVRERTCEFRFPFNVKHYAPDSVSHHF